MVLPSGRRGELLHFPYAAGYSSDVGRVTGHFVITRWVRPDEAGVANLGSAGDHLRVVVLAAGDGDLAGLGPVGDGIRNTRTPLS
jgi:hypothetical protein